MKSMPLNIPVCSQEIPAVALVCKRQINGIWRGRRGAGMDQQREVVRVQVILTPVNLHEI